MNLHIIDELPTRIPHYQSLLDACRAERVDAWLVGGCVRDLLLDRDPADIDVTTAEPEALARQLAGLLGAHVVPMDRERGIWRVAYAADRYFDLCRFRAADILDDLRGRDFTFNAIAIRLPAPGEAATFFDPLHGLADLRAMHLRQAAPEAFHDDPARVLRAFRFLAEFPLEIEPATWAALGREAGRLPRVAPERLLAEWWKLCAGPFALPAIARMEAAGVLPLLFPELKPAKGLTQNAYHHLDVWEHMLLAAQNMAGLLARRAELPEDLQPDFAAMLDDPHRRARLLFLALIHDIGKPPTRSEEEGRIHFYGHDRAGAELAEGLCRRLRMSREDTRVITTSIRLHLRPLQLLQAQRRGKVSDKDKLSFLVDAGDSLPEILALGLADKAAGLGPAADPDVLAQLHTLYRDLLAFYHTRYQPAQTAPLLTGADLIAHLHLQPGPHLGHLLHRARELQILGKLTSREEALQWAERNSSEC